MREYVALLRRRPGYRALWTAEVISITGDWFSIVAVSVLSARGSSASGALALAMVLAAHLLPQALLSPVAGWLADRFDRRALLIGGNLLEGLLTLGMAAAAAGGHVFSVQALLFVRAAVAAVREPAAGAALPRLVGQKEIGAANALGASTWSLTFVVGMALGGLATELGPAVALLIDAGTFFVASGILVRLPRLRAEREGSVGRSFSEVVRGAGADLVAAARAAARPDARGGVYGKTPLALASGVAWMALNLSAHERPFLGGAAATLGVLQAVRGVGTGVGPLAARALVRRAGVRTVAHTSAAIALLGAGAMAFAEGTAASLAAVLAWGVGGGALWVITQTEILEGSEDAMRGRMLALDAIGFTVGMSGTAVAAALLLEAGVPLAHTALAVGAVALALWLWLRSGLPLAARSAAAVGAAD